MRKFAPFFIGFCFALLAGVALALPPYDITVTFNPPITGGAPDGYNLYINDCAATGPIAAPFGAVATGQTFVGALTADGIYTVCVRAFNTAGEVVDPGPVATIDVADLPLPGPVENLDITVQCPNGGCTVGITVN